MKVESPILIVAKLVTRDKIFLEKKSFRIGVLDLQFPLTLFLCIFDLKGIKLRETG